MGKTNYLMEKEWNALFRSLPKEDAGELIQAICAFTDGEEQVIDNPLLASVCEMIKRKIASNDEAYENTSLKKSLANLKRWHPELYEIIQNDPDERALFVANPNEWISIHKDDHVSSCIDTIRHDTKRIVTYPDTDETDTVSDTVTVTDTVNNKDIKHKYGEYKNVLLTDKELEKLKTEYPDSWEERIESLSAYIESKGAKYKNHLATIRNWARRENAKPKARGKPPDNAPFVETIPDDEVFPWEKYDE